MGKCEEYMSVLSHEAYFKCPYIYYNHEIHLIYILFALAVNNISMLSYLILYSTAHLIGNSTL